MNDKDRVAALIIQDGKLLLVTGYNVDYYWTPGGKIDEEEDHEQALKREMKEELGIDITHLRLFTQMDYHNPQSGKMQTSYYYLVGVEGELKPDKEVTGYRFFNAEEIPHFVHFINDQNLLSKLFEEKLLI